MVLLTVPSVGIASYFSKGEGDCKLDSVVCHVDKKNLDHYNYGLLFCSYCSYFAS